MNQTKLTNFKPPEFKIMVIVDRDSIHRWEPDGKKKV